MEPPQRLGQGQGHHRQIELTPSEKRLWRFALYKGRKEDIQEDPAVKEVLRKAPRVTDILVPFGDSAVRIDTSARTTGNTERERERESFLFVCGIQVTPLHEAVNSRNKEIVKVLLEDFDADVNAVAGEVSHISDLPSMPP